MNDKKFHPIGITYAQWKDQMAEKKFNNPFHYQPDVFCLQAAKNLQTSLRGLEEGKMFGVLIVEKDNQVGYLQAFSGQMNHTDIDTFVPAIFDYLQPEGYFKKKEAEISSINQQINHIQSSESYNDAMRRYQMLCREAATAIQKKKNTMLVAKRLREKQRQEANQTASEKSEMIKESQFLKAELTRTKKHYAALIATSEAHINGFEVEINRLKKQRKKLSDRLQRWLFAQFRLKNARGETRNLIDLFRDFYLENSPARSRMATMQATHSNTSTSEALLPPSGAGECCEPKLLQYAFLHGMKPLSMAMFWWGTSPKGEVRKEGQFYPACSGKCRPVLAWMLKGLEVEDDHPSTPPSDPLKIIYEDDELAVVVKPSGLLSVPGKGDKPSVYSLLEKRWTMTALPLMVHRLDMDTSGLMVVARTKYSHQALQQQFENHTIEKRYIAIIDTQNIHSNLSREGSINLPLRADTDDRPRQIVDHENGKPAITEYRLLEPIPSNDVSSAHAMKIALFPKTGRTHQLRIHCAHKEGLNAPIIGDALYGSTAKRLYLHAEYLAFTHPLTGKRMTFEEKWDGGNGIESTQ